MTSRTKEKLVVAAAIAAFLLYKLAQMSFRFGDGNAYIYMADRVLHGGVLYRDFFLADPPLLVYILSLFKLLFGKYLILFLALPVIFEAATAWLVYLILQRREAALAWLAPFAYLFSFTVIATSDFLTGIQATLFFFALGIFFFESRKDFWAGVCFSLAILVKMYALPLVAGSYLYLIAARQWPRLKKTASGSLAAALLILLPSLVLAPGQLWDYLVTHQLNRPSGHSKLMVWQFFLAKEWLILALGALGLVVKKAYPYLAAFILTALFLLWFRDLYYVYFQTLLFLAAFGTVWFASWWWDNRDTRPLAVIALVALLGVNLYRITDYQAHHAPFGRFTNAPELAAYAQTLDQPLYGSHEAVPLLALLSGKKLFQDYIDTNAQAFVSNGQNLKQASAEAVLAGVYLVARITDRPDLGIQPTGFEGYFDPEQFQHCQVAKEFESPSRETDNKIVFYFCKKN